MVCKLDQNEVYKHFGINERYNMTENSESYVLDKEV